MLTAKKLRDKRWNRESRRRVRRTNLKRNEKKTGASRAVNREFNRQAMLLKRGFIGMAFDIGRRIAGLLRARKRT